MERRGSPQPGALHATGIEKALLYSAFEDHEKAESSSREVGARLSASRPALLQSKARAVEFCRVQRKKRGQKKRRKKKQAL